MSGPQEQYAVEPKQQDDDSYEQKMLKRVNDDMSTAEQFRSTRQKIVDEYRKQYRNSQYYEEFRAIKEQPLPIAQQLVDQFVALQQDKIGFNNQPARAVGTPGTDPAEVDAIQSMTDWQDYRDGIIGKLGDALNSCAVDGHCVAQVDFLETKKWRWRVVNDEFGPDQWQRVEEIDYIGPVVKMIDSNSLYYSGDKKNLADPFPLMVKSPQAREFFDSKPYFFNQTLLDDEEQSTSTKTTDSADIPNVTEERISFTNVTGRIHDYVEWQAPVNKAELYEFMVSKGMEDQVMSPEGEMPQVDPAETTWAIIGVADKKTVVRLQEAPFGLNRPNILVGCIQKDGSVFRGIGLLDLIFSLCRGADQAAGMMIENVVQSIDSGWGLDRERVHGATPVINSRNFIFECDGNPNEVLKRLDQPNLSDPLAALIEFYFTKAKEAAKLPDVTLGRGDKNAETLGENAMAESHATVGLSEYLRVFEETFLRPLYQMRNEISVELIDQEFVYGVIGDGAVHWSKPMQPSAVRASVDFICESSTRETNKAVTTSQMTAFLDMAPNLVAAGTPVGIGAIAKILAQNGFSMSQETIDTILPLEKLAKEQEIDVGALIAQTALDKLQAEAILAKIQLDSILAGQIPGQGVPDDPGGGAGGPTAQPMTGAEAEQNVNQENQVTLRE